jgi:hypothetical protein
MDRILNLQLSLFGKWNWDNNPHVSYFFLDSNELDVIVGGMPFTMRYDCYLKDDLLMVKVTNPRGKDMEPQIKDYEVKIIDGNTGELVLESEKGAIMSFHQDKGFAR